MNAERLLAHFETISEAPDAVARLRRFILDLAVRGKLVEQDPEDEPAEELLKKAAADILNYQTQFNIRSHKTLERSELASSFPLPQGWLWTQPFRIFRSITDGDHQAPPRSPDGIPFLVIGDVRNRSINYEADRFVPETYYEALSVERRPTKGDLLYTLVGSYGIPVIVRGDAPFCVQRHIGILRPSPFVSVEFLALLMDSMLVYEQASNIATGIAQKTVPLGGLRKLRIPLPPLAEQRRIVAKVDELMALCDQLEASRQQREHQRERLVAASLQRLSQPSEDPATARNDARFALQVLPSLTTTPAQIKQLRQAILNLAVRGKLVEQDPEDEPAEAYLRLINAKPAERGDFCLPRQWAWVSVGEVSTARLGKMLDKAKNKGTERPYLRNINVRWLDFDLSDLLEMKFEDSELAEYELRKGDVLICEGGEPGRAAVWDDRARDIYFQKAIHRVRFDECVDPLFFVHALRCSAQDERLTRYFTGTGISHFTGKSLKAYLFPLPPLAEQRRIVAKVDELMALCDQMEQQLSQADQQRRRLLEAVLAEALREPAGALALTGP